jgi:hypothetical protein
VGSSLLHDAPRSHARNRGGLAGGATKSAKIFVVREGASHRVSVNALSACVAGLVVRRGTTKVSARTAYTDDRCKGDRQKSRGYYRSTTHTLFEVSSV